MLAFVDSFSIFRSATVGRQKIVSEKIKVMGRRIGKRMKEKSRNVMKEGYIFLWLCGNIAGKIFNLFFFFWATIILLTIIKWDWQRKGRWKIKSARKWYNTYNTLFLRLRNEHTLFSNCNKTAKTRINLGIELNKYAMRFLERLCKWIELPAFAWESALIILKWNKIIREKCFFNDRTVKSIE